ncbi:MAG: wbpI [Burkholderia sp.]|jgi:UDP-GlcNAc3NAcA epimerase|nr:wbpI [Burkholderia sp.]
MNIFTVVGARPQFIKAAVVSHAMQRVPDMRETLLHTGQHFDANMSTVFFDELGIPTPEFNLDIHGGHHGDMTGRMLEGIERMLLAHRPDMVLIYGDTNSTIAGALAAAKLHIPVAHVEAGLRSYNRRMPEEINRVLADHASDLLFAPTQTAVRNLAQEGITGDKVLLTGDVMYDAALHFKEIAFARSAILRRLDLSDRPYVLCTIHRAENTDDLARLRNIFTALDMLAREIHVVLPMHPRTVAVLAKAGFDHSFHRNLQMIEPIGYLDMVRLESSAALIVTDSGGVQKEAFFQRVPCVTLRDETEWVELVEAGWNRLAPPKNPQLVLDAMRDAIGTDGENLPLYGTGDAALNIVRALNAA